MKNVFSLFLQLLEQVLGSRPEFTMPAADDVEEVDMLDLDLRQDETYLRNAHMKRDYAEHLEGDPMTCVPM